MNRKGMKFAGGIFALLFVPGTIPAFIAFKTAQYRKKRIAQNELEG